MSPTQTARLVATRVRRSARAACAIITAGALIGLAAVAAARRPGGA